MPKKVLPLIIPDSLGDRVVSHLRDEIVAGALKPGVVLRLAALQTRFGVSTTPIREALARLKRQGLVEGELHKGVRVAELSRQDLHDAYSLHAFMARLLTERAATLLSDEELEELTRLNHEIEQANDRGDLNDAERLNYQFHRNIHLAAHSNLLQHLMMETTPFVSRRADPRVPGWGKQRVEHGPILKALKERNGKLAGRLMEEHILRSGELLLAYAQQPGAVNAALT